MLHVHHTNSPDTYTLHMHALYTFLNLRVKRISREKIDKLHEITLNFLYRTDPANKQTEKLIFQYCTK